MYVFVLLQGKTAKNHAPYEVCQLVTASILQNGGLKRWHLVCCLAGGSTARRGVAVDSKTPRVF